ncbi:BnaC02g34890D [Brassica napus]|uniref:BnaC02g34890D protein n=1 Tax=Brassica napus TaxID=3708 RepID=A0A078HHI8_BRANA|nr:BnaC02g34890D [Brassica napus]
MESENSVNNYNTNDIPLETMQTIRIFTVC